jgi:hypothetical protein
MADVTFTRKLGELPRAAHGRHEDPGAASTVLILRALATVTAEPRT